MTEKYKNKIFFITPIGKEGSPERIHADFMLSEVLRPMEKEINMEFVRADEVAETPDKIDEIYEYIRYAEMLIVDFFKLNPNVLHETGIALAWGKVPILIAPSDERIPFDLRQLSYIKYAVAISEPNATHHIKNLQEPIKTKIEKIKQNPETMCYKRITHFLEKTDSLGNKIDTISNDVKEILARKNIFNAEYIEGEKNAFDRLTDAIRRAKIMVKTTRFSPFAVSE